MYCFETLFEDVDDEDEDEDDDYWFNIWPMRGKKSYELIFDDMLSNALFIYFRFVQFLSENAYISYWMNSLACIFAYF